jgi:superfamily II DNA/RNA helicase
MAKIDLSPKTRNNVRILIQYAIPHQREIILAALDGKDVFVQAATSFGKSLCFQLPAVIDRGSMSFWDH